MNIRGYVRPIYNVIKRRYIVLIRACQAFDALQRHKKTARIMRAVEENYRMSAASSHALLAGIRGLPLASLRLLPGRSHTGFPRHRWLLWLPVIVRFRAWLSPCLRPGRACSSRPGPERGPGRVGHGLSFCFGYRRGASLLPCLACLRAHARSVPHGWPRAAASPAYCGKGSQRPDGRTGTS